MVALLIYFAVPAILTACWFFHQLWPKQSVKILRDELFAVRDELFEFVKVTPEIDFEDVAYGMLRSNINGYIRFADTINLWTMVSLKRLPSPEGVRPWSERWENYLRDYSPEVRGAIEMLHFKAITAVFRHALRTSLVAHFWIGLKKLMDRFRAPVESAGEAYGEEHAIDCGTAAA